MKKILIAAMAVFALASCSKDNGGENTEIEGKEAKLDLVIGFPETQGTKATDPNSSAQDTKIEKVTVFIFKGDGSAEAGNGTSFAVTDFVSAGDNKWALKESERITTKSGTKKIYVGINLDATTIASATNENTFINAAAATGLYTSTAVAMLSKGKSQMLNAQEVGTNPTKNKVEITVERLVSKIAVTAGSGAVTIGTGQTYTITPDMFTVGNVATKFYPVQRMAAGKLVTPLVRTQAPFTLKALNANAKAAKNLTSFFYVPENTTTALQRGEATYAVVRAKVTFSHFAKLNADGTTIGYTPSGTPSGDVFVVRSGDKVYFCANETDADNIISISGICSKFKYKNATGNYYTFYYVFINPDATDALALYRNQFRNITIGTVKGIGVPGAPTTPTDPTDPIIDPEEPAKETEAYLEVIVDVKEWDYAAVPTDLE